MSGVRNVFQSVRPRGSHAAPATTATTAPSAAPRANARRGCAATAAHPDRVRVLNVNGQRRATLAPRVYASPPVLGREASQAHNDKSRAIVRGGI